MSGAKLLLHLYAFMAWTGTNMDAVRHLKPFWSTISVRFIGQCWYFNPQWTPVRAIIKAGCVGNYVSQLGQMRIYRVLTYTSGLLERCLVVKGGSIPLVPQRNPDPQVSCSISNVRSVADRSEQNSSKLRRTMRPIYGWFGKFKGLTARRLYGSFGSRLQDSGLIVFRAFFIWTMYICLEFFCFCLNCGCQSLFQTVTSKSLMLVEFLFAVLLCLLYLNVLFLKCRKLHAVCDNGLNAYRNLRRGLVSVAISFILFS
jgi:hypothetical protein